MQRTDEKGQNADAKEKEIDIIVFDTAPNDVAIYEAAKPIIGKGVVWEASMDCDPSKW